MQSEPWTNPAGSVAATQPSGNPGPRQCQGPPCGPWPWPCQPQSSSWSCDHPTGDVLGVTGSAFAIPEPSASVAAPSAPENATAIASFFVSILVIVQIPYAPRIANNHRRATPPVRPLAANPA